MEDGRSPLQPSRAAFLRAWLREASSECSLCSWVLGGLALTAVGGGEVLCGTSGTWEPVPIEGSLPASSLLSVVGPTQK